MAPKDPKYVKQEELCERSAFISGKGLRRVPLPPSQGEEVAAERMTG